MAVSARERYGIRTVQALRALACLLVVAYHAGDAWGAHQMPPLPADTLWPNGASGVDLFFVISGFVMARSGARLSGWEAARRFMARRLLRIVPLYWAMTAAKLALLVALPAMAWPGAWHVLASFAFLPSHDSAGMVRPVLGVGWTLQFEMLFYGLFALCVAAGRPALRVLPAVLLPLAVAGFWRQASWPAPGVLANGLVMEFCFGLAVAAWLEHRSLPQVAAWALLLAGAVLLMVVPQPGAWRLLAWGLPATLMLAGAVALEPLVGRRIPGPVLVGGEASYAIYLLHPFIVPALAHRIAGLAGLVVISLAAATGGGVALHRAFDQPLQLWLAGRRNRPERASFPAAAQLVQP